MTEHSDWLAQVEISGPFLAEPVLREAFPQGFEGLDASKRQLLRKAYDEWREAIDLDDVDAEALHQAWINLVLRQGLEYQDVLKSRADLGDDVRHEVAEHGVTLRPDHAVVSAGDNGKLLCLISIYGPEVNLTDVSKGDAWSASPADRMVDLCRALGVRLGLVTNGEHWMLVDAPVAGVASFATWHARLWGQEPFTLQAFVNLLGVRRFFADAEHQLTRLLDQSLEHQDEVTEALGEQVRRAIEVLIQALDRADVDRQRELLRGLAPRDIYEAALTVMMRIVFLLSAEERGLLLMGDERYEANYAVSTLRLQLRNEPPEILERRWDAWSRLLSIFRIVYGGVEHDALRLPALGGSLFDPDRFPFLEGRAPGTTWKAHLATPLPIDNRTVLLLLDAVQLFQGRTLSYRALDVEQIGHVYEGLLERTVARAEEATLDLDATKNARHPWVTLPELDAARAAGGTALADLLKERTGSAASRVTNDLARAVDDADADRLLTACHGDQDLRGRIKPYFHLIRTDRWGYPLVYPKGAYMVASGSDRRETGAHYTPKSLTERIVSETLEPVVFVGPSSGQPRQSWVLRTAEELLSLRICDPAMGSGAFLVQVCRYLSERLVDAWKHAEASGKVITADGSVVDAIGSSEPLTGLAEERITIARRLVAERCLYGVDLNPLAVELAKLSIWLVTLAKGRPFEFLDHNVRCGDSLLGVEAIEKLARLSLKDGGERQLFAGEIEAAVSAARELRTQLRRLTRDIRDVEMIARATEEATDRVKTIDAIADALVANHLLQTDGREEDLAVEVGAVLHGDAPALAALNTRIRAGLSLDLPEGKPVRMPFHWALEFPEVFGGEKGGFDSIVGNPPFLGGQKITGALGTNYREYLVDVLAGEARGSADLVAYFFLRAYSLLREGGTLGLLAVNTIAEGDTREVGLQRLRASGATIYRAYPNEPWPGAAAVVTSRIHLTAGNWGGEVSISGTSVPTISAFLTGQEEWVPKPLTANAGKSFQGSIVLGMGFVVSAQVASDWLHQNPDNEHVLFPYLNGKDLSSSHTQTASRWVINFWDWSEEKAALYTLPYEHTLKSVKPERQRRKRNGEFKLKSPLPQQWWKYLRSRPPLYHAIGHGNFFDVHPEGWVPVTPMARVIVFGTQASKYPLFSFADSNQVFSHALGVIVSKSAALFALLNSDLHSHWAFKYGGRLESRLRYAPTDCFETFPFPEGLEANAKLSELGEQLSTLRRRITVSRRVGLTTLYNQFHDQSVQHEDILELRQLHLSIEREVHTAFGLGEEPVFEFRNVLSLPANDRIRYTLSSDSVSAVLDQLAQLNRSLFQRQPPEAGRRMRSRRATASAVEPTFFEDLDVEEEI